MVNWHIAFVIIITVSINHFVITITDNCWTNDDACLIHAKLYKNALNSEIESMYETLPLDIDCSTTKTQNDVAVTSVTQPPDYLLRRFERAYELSLNGCHKALKWSTFGFEFLPNCDKITKLTLEQFHTDTLYTLQCTRAIFLQLEILNIHQNEIATITAESLNNLSLVRELYFESNSLRHIENDAFNNLHFIDRLYIENEPLLILKDAKLFQNTNIANLRLIGLKQVTSAVFENLPETLLNLSIAKTSISIDNADDVNSLYIKNPRLLRNLSIIDCKLRVFKLNDMHGSVTFLNLSGNQLKDFEIITNGTNVTSDLIVLDLSNNQLTHLPWQLLQQSVLQKLENLNLQNNLLKQLPLLKLLSSMPSIKFIDLTENKLERLSKSDDQLKRINVFDLRIRINSNPWNCKWLFEFAHANPEMFRIFQYEKFLSQINVNGLACEPSDAVKDIIPRPGRVNISPENSKRFNLNTNDTYLNISTFTLIYGSPWEIKRNQRSEALIIVFMLPVGIAILFLLLYLWIYCQKVFHLSFYQKCPLFKRTHAHHRNAIANRFDIVRQLPPNNALATSINNNEGYELPLNGISPICNCVNSLHNTPKTDSISEKCNKTHHITYVPLPDEQAQQIYEEIIASNEDMNKIDKDVTTQKVYAVYDHLTYDE